MKNAFLEGMSAAASFGLRSKEHEIGGFREDGNKIRGYWTKVGGFISYGMHNYELKNGESHAKSPERDTTRTRSTVK